LSATGYYVVKGDGDMIVFDCGEIGPDYQPGHAHCDTLSFELYLDGQRILTNTGNHDYGVGATRAYARSTRAHNTVVVDDSEQSEVWGAFRVGRRARPLGAKLELQDGSVIFQGGHDGYRRLAGSVTHTRTALVSRDFVIELKDDLMGEEYHRASSWLHAAVGLSIIEAERGYEILDEFGRRLVRLEPASGCRASIEHSARYPEFGVISAGMSLCLSAEGSLPIALACRIIPLRGGQ
jgi:hypothetical protein